MAIAGNNSLTASAGRDLNVTSTTRTQTNAQGSRTHIDRIAGLYVTNPGGILIAAAGRDLSLTAAQIVNSGESGSTVIAAGHNLNLGSVTESANYSTIWNQQHYRKDSSRSDIGSTIQTQGDIHLQAGNDLNAKAAHVTSEQGALIANAGHNINLTTGEAHQSVDEALQVTGGNSMFSKTTTTTRDKLSETLAVGTTFSGNSAALQAGHDPTVSGSNIVATQDTVLLATNNITLAAANNTFTENHFKDEKKSGLFSSGGLSLTYGNQQQSADAKNIGTRAAASTVGSIQGNVSITAGNAFSQIGSSAVTPQGDIDIHAQKIDIKEAHNTSQSEQETKFKQSGLTLALTSPIISAIQTAQQMKEAASQTKDKRMQVLAASTAVLAAKNAYDAVAADPQAGGGISLSITVGGTTSEGQQTQTSNSAQGSTVAAGGNVNLTTTGAGKDSDITVQGSSIKAGNDASLQADGDINLLASNNTNEQHSTNNSQSAGVGVAISYGSDGFAFGITANASAARGKADGQDTIWTNSHVEAGNQLTLASGGDTTLKGAVASGRQVTADVGGNLNIASLQDTSVYNSKDQSLGGSVTIGYGFAMSVNASQQKIDSNFASVTEQSGIKAGDDGFRVNVKGSTDLKGAVIASTGQAVQDGENSLTTGTLTTSDLQNKAEFNASSVGIGGGYSQGSSMIPLGGGSNTAAGGVGTDQQGNAQTGASQTPGSTLPSLNGFSATSPVAMSASGDASSTTKSGISGAEISITDDEKQQALTGKNADTTVASLNRDVSSDKDSNALTPIFNEQEIKAGFAIAGAFSREAGTFLVNRAKEADAKTQTAKDKDAQADIKLNQAESLPDGEEKTRLQHEAQTARTEAIAARMEAKDIEDKWGSGGSYRQVMTAITAAAGNVTASGSQFVQSAVVNLIQSNATQGIKQLADNLGIAEGSPAHAALHAISACAGATAQGSDCGSAAMGAASASVVGALLAETQGGAEKLTNEQKEARQNLVTTLVTGVVAATGNAAAANTAALIEMENNSNVKNAVKVAINDAKDYLGAKGKQGLEKTAELLEKLEFKSLTDKQQAIARYLDEAAAHGGLTEAEIAVFGIIYAANATLFPTSVLDIIPGAGKAVSKTGNLIKLGIKAEDAAKVAAAEMRTVHAVAGPIYKTTKEATQAAEALGFQRINEMVNGQAVYRRGKDFITRDVDGHNGGAWKLADSVKNLASKETRSGTYNTDLKRIGD